MSKLTITEALAEIKTIDKRLEKKRQFIHTYACRQEYIKDPLLSDGGSVEGVKRERQAILDLEERKIKIRAAIQRGNIDTLIMINTKNTSITRNIADWLIWKREVAPGQQAFLDNITKGINKVRKSARDQGLNTVTGAAAVAGNVTKSDDVLICVDEAELARQEEDLAEILGTLDGKLSLVNATTLVEIVD